MTKPQLIILYGPPGSGKGTQAKILEQELGYTFLDFGQCFRDFARVNYELTNPDKKRAIRVNELLISGKPILTEDFFYILKDKIEFNIRNNINFIIDKPGSLIEEAKWFNMIIKKNKIQTIFIHLELNNAEALDRITHRWYLPSNPTPFPSEEEALNNAINNEEPYQRKEDQSDTISAQRIINMYSQHETIINEYKKNGIIVHNINADQSIEGVKKDIQKLLQ
jgi:adenylate kinase